jgi:hypothetical protein
MRDDLRRHRRPRKHSLDRYVVFSIAMLIIYTIVAIWASFKGVQYDTLTTCFYMSFGGEILSCALIKIYKLKEPSDPEE